MRRVGSLGIGLVAFACSRTEPDRGGLMIVVSQDGPVDVARLDVNVQARGKTLLDNNYRVPQETELPTTIAVVSNQDETSQATVRISAWTANDSDELQPLDRRDAIVTQIPSDRVALLRVVLSGRCVGTVEEVDGEIQSTCPDGKTCDPGSGDCSGVVKVSSSSLGEYHPGDEKGVVVVVREARDGRRDGGLADGAVGEVSTRDESSNATSSDGKATMSSTGETSSSSVTDGMSSSGATDTASSSEGASSSGAAEDAGPVCGGEVCVVRDAGGGGCGDGVVDFSTGEECDPGTTPELVDANGDSPTCNGASAGDAGCRRPTCGDGYTNSAARTGTDPLGNPIAEQCDNGPDDTEACNGRSGSASRCQEPTCADARVNRAVGEECDTHPSSELASWILLPQETFPDPEACNSSEAGDVACKRARCGDGFTNAASEQCDPENLVDPNHQNCNPTSAGGLACTLSQCGDGIVGGAEECDPAQDGAFSGEDSARCNGTLAGDFACTMARCGDGYHNTSAEDCDDGFQTATCTSLCTMSYCGDGLVNEITEQCDRTAGGAWPAGCLNAQLNGNLPGELECQLTKCGDDYLDTSKESCSDPPPAGKAYCREDCI